MNSSPAEKHSPDFLAYLRAHPDASVSAIVRYEQAPEGFQGQVEGAGLTITRQLRLIRGLAVEGKGQALLELAQAPWVSRIEPDQPVHTMR